METSLYRLYATAIHPIQHTSLYSLPQHSPPRCEEEERLQNFSCLNVQCTKPADRQIVLAAIRKNWREHPETREEVEAKDAYWVFDTFVKTELRKVLLKSKASYATYAMP